MSAQISEITVTLGNPLQMTPFPKFARQRAAAFGRLCILLWLSMAISGHAAFVVVTNATDDPTTPAAGSLRKAIADAANDDTIQFDPAVTGTITLAGAELVIAKNLTITGPGAPILAISGNAKSRVFSISAGAAVTISGLTIQNGKASDGANGANGQVRPGSAGDGSPGESGGGVLNAGDLTVLDCVFSGNAAGKGGAGGKALGGGGPSSTGYGGNGAVGGNGGALFSSGVLRLTRCTVTGNSSGVGGAGGSVNGYGQTGLSGKGGGGGGIYNASAQVDAVSLDACTVSANQAGAGGYGGDADFGRNGGLGGAGGGVFNAAGAASFNNCTLSGNIAGKGGQRGTGPFPFVGTPGNGGDGGAIYNASAVAMTVTSCTISANAAGANGSGTSSPPNDGKGGGIANNAVLRNTIVAGNNVGTSPDLFGGFTTQGHNLIGAIDGSTGVSAGVNGDIAGTSAAPLNPGLAPLGDYAGPTFTHALPFGSPAIDAGDDALAGTDQRGHLRPFGSHVDIGAYEDDSIAVTNATDAIAPAAGSLRKAIADAPAGGTIQFSPAVTGTITLAGSELVIAKNLKIIGPGAAILAISGNAQSRVFSISPGATATISGLTIREGKAPNGADGAVGVPPTAGGDGGGILNTGNLTMSDCRIVANVGGRGGKERNADHGRLDHGADGGRGGGIASTGALIMDRCTVSGNVAGRGGDGGNVAPFPGTAGGVGGWGGPGGGISCFGVLTMNRCTISGNLGGQGANGGYGDAGGSGGPGGGSGGILINQGSNVSLDSCTLSGNIGGAGGQGGFTERFQINAVGGPGGSGGAIGGTGASVVVLTSCTVTANAAGNGTAGGAGGDGGGINLDTALLNTIVAGNNVGTGSSLGMAPDLKGAFTTLGHNLIGKTDGSTGITGGANGDLAGTIAAPLNPGLAPLAGYGGTALTHALVSSSPAIDAGDDALAGIDQRGHTRPIGSHVDIGAYEYDAVALSYADYITAYGFSVANAGALADPDGDGISNVEENGLDLAADIPNRAGLPIVAPKNYAGVEYLSMTFTRMTTAVDLTYTAQVSSNLTNWTDMATSVAGAVTSGPGFVSETGAAPILTVEVRDTTAIVPGAKRFMRLKITK